MHNTKMIAPVYNNQYEIIVTGDMNDGDYNITINLLEEKEFEMILPILRKIKPVLGEYNTYNSYNDEIPTWGTEEEWDLLTEYLKIPGDGQANCHTIDSIDIYYQDKFTLLRCGIEI